MRKSVFFLEIIVVLLLLFCVAIPLAVSQDTDPPQLLEFDFDPKNIDTNISPQTVTFTFRVTDNLSGCLYITLFLESPSGQQGKGLDLDAGYRISGDDLDGIYQGSIEIPQYSESGTWNLQYISMGDSVGNYAYLYEQELINLGFPTKLGVQGVQGVDVAPPQLMAFDYNPKSIDTSNTSQTVVFTLRVTDNLSGYSWATLFLESPSRQQGKGLDLDAGYRISGDDLDGIYQGSIEIPQYSESGTWNLQYISLADSVGNYAYLYEQDVITLGFPTKLEVVSNPDDAIPPNLLEFNFDPKNIDTNISPQTVTFTFRVTDNLSGCLYITLFLENPSGQQGKGLDLDAGYRISGDDLDGIYQGSIEIPQYSESGTWNLQYISMGDSVGNYAYLYEQELINLGFPTKLENGLLSGGFWAEVKNTPAGIWRLRQTPGTGDVLMLVPNGWVVKVLDTHQNSQVHGGYIWWEVESPGNGAVGWMASKKSDWSQTYLVQGESEKAAEVPMGDRIDKLLEAMDHYYNGTDSHYPDHQTTDLYSSNDWGYNDSNPQNEFRDANNISYLKDYSFPVELMLAIAAQESGDYDFDNEVYGADRKKADPLYALYGGVGVMQITTTPDSNSRGWASNLKCYKNAYRLADIPGGTYPYSGGSRYRHYYYTNTSQGIYANMKDGLRSLQYNYYVSRHRPNPNKYATWVGTAWRYNHGGTACPITQDKRNYLLNLVGRLDNLDSDSYFSDYKAKLNEFREQNNSPEYAFLDNFDMAALANVLLNYKLLNICSPGELRAYDSQGRVTGVVDGEIFKQIPDSDYYNDAVLLMLEANDSSRYEVVGREEGEYGLVFSSIENGEITEFSASEIPTNPGTIHQYTIDWESLSQNQEGVNVEIDFDGDGAFELAITTGGSFLSASAAIDFDPDTLNLKSKSKWATCYIELSEAYDAEEIAPGTVRLWIGSNSILAEDKPFTVGDYDIDGIPDLMVKFRREAIIGFLRGAGITTGDATLTINGQIGSSMFEGTDTIRIINPGKGKDQGKNAPAEPTEFALLQNFSNPFNPDTWIPYQLAEDVDVNISIYHVSGKLVRTLSLGLKSAGFYIDKEKAAYWDGRNEAGEQVSSGIYFYTIQAGDFVATRKMTLAK